MSTHTHTLRTHMQGTHKGQTWERSCWGSHSHAHSCHDIPVHCGCSSGQCYGLGPEATKAGQKEKGALFNPATLDNRAAARRLPFSTSNCQSSQDLDDWLDISGDEAVSPLKARCRVPSNQRRTWDKPAAGSWSQGRCWFCSQERGTQLGLGGGNLQNKEALR